MRPHGTGSVYFAKDRDRWIGEALIDGKTRRVVGKNKTDAGKRIRDLIDAAKLTPATANPKLTVESIVRRFLDRSVPAKELAPSTVDTHRWAAGIVVEEIGPVRANELGVAKIEDMFDRLAESGYSKASLVKVRSTLSQALRDAVRRGELPTNAAKDAEIPSTAERTKKRRSLTRDEARALVDVLRDERDGLLFAFMLRLGLRPGEASALYWQDLERGVVNVVRSVRLSNGRAEVVEELKTTASRRTLAIPADLVDWITDHAARITDERADSDSWGDERLVSPTSSGTVVSPSNLRRRLRELTVIAGVSDVTPNELRHSAASILSDAGVSNEQIADLLGHATTRMVDQTYRHRLRPVVDVAGLVEL